MTRFQEMFSQVPDKPENSVIEYAVQWTLNRFKQRDYGYLEVEFPGDIALAVAQVLRTYLTPKGYLVSIGPAEKPFYRVTIQ